jgi:acyl carrier protein
MHEIKIDQKRKNEISQTVQEIMRDFLEKEIGFNLEDGDEPLRIILSDSVQAMNFITLLESEFEIEFDDDEIDLEFFSSIKLISDLIYKYLGSKTLF